MLRTAVCVLLVSSIVALGVDDTEKRRSEEILRAVAAAATADYEGLQHMKFQKSATRTKIMETTETKGCVSALLKALIEEKNALQESIEDDVEQNLENIEGDVALKRQQLKDAINQAIVKVYTEIKRRYTELEDHSGKMKDALEAEMEARTGDIDGQNSPEKLFTAIMKHAAIQLNNGEEKLDEATVQQHLAEMMLADARKKALEHTENLDKTERPDETTDADYIRIENILLAAGVAGNAQGSMSGIDFPLDSAQGFDYRSAMRTTTGRPTIWSGNVRHKSRDNTTMTKWNLKMTNLEKVNLQKLETQFVEWTIAKSKYHNVSTEKSAYDAAAAMVDMKIRAVTGSKDSINSYATELAGLEDDEMRKIADIKDEFESLAADWLQLATYHCCDIVQGNAIECTDATNHLIEPINSVFPHALKKPDVATDCTRRLL